MAVAIDLLPQPVCVWEHFRDLHRPRDFRTKRWSWRTRTALGPALAVWAGQIADVRIPGRESAA
jgi:hypothetical protein